MLDQKQFVEFAKHVWTESTTRLNGPQYFGFDGLTKLIVRSTTRSTNPQFFGFSLL